MWQLRLLPPRVQIEVRTVPQVYVIKNCWHLTFCRFSIRAVSLLFLFSSFCFIERFACGVSGNGGTGSSSTAVEA